MEKKKRTYWIKNIFSDRSGEASSMRLILIMLSVLCCMLLYSIYFYINSWITLGKDPNWIGLASFVGAMTTLIGVVVYGKVKQKGIEDDISPFTPQVPFQSNINKTINTVTTNLKPQQDELYSGYSEGK